MPAHQFKGLAISFRVAIGTFEHDRTRLSNIVETDALCDLSYLAFLRTGLRDEHQSSIAR